MIAVGHRKRLCLVAIIAAFSNQVTNGLKIQCPEGWIGFSESPSCYKFFDKEESFEDAKLSCQNIASTLAQIGTKPERDFLSTSIGQLSGEQVDRVWWLGISYNNDSAEYRWLDQSTINTEITPWAENYPKENESCGVLDQKGKLETSDCTDARFYACEKPIGAPVKCGPGWEHHQQFCYKRYHHELMSFDEARMKCQEEDSDLVTVTSFAENKFIYDFANRDQVDVWLGIRENETLGEFVWVDGTPDGDESVVSAWEDDQPVLNHGLNAGFMAASSHDRWSTKEYIQRLGFVCKKNEGEFCQFDTVGEGSNCYNFEIGDGNYHDWLVAASKCTEVGMTLVTLEDDVENSFVSNYVRGAGLSEEATLKGMWLGYSETDVNSQTFLRISDNKTTDAEDVFKSFVDEPAFSDELKDGAYLLICPEEVDFCPNTWDVAPLDPDGKLYSCEFPKGVSLDVSGIMHPKLECPEGWGEHFSGYCYLPVATEHDWATAQSFCRDNNTKANLVSILSDYENDFVRELAIGLGRETWIGLSDRFNEGQWIWNDGKAPSFLPWATDEPNGGKNENCGQITDTGAWRDHMCSELHPFICKVEGKESGDPIIPETSTVPPNPNCGYGSGWVEDPITGMCYNFVKEAMNWVDARHECKIRGGYREHGDLASVNSLQEQIFIHTSLATSGTNEQHWIGLNDLDATSSYLWSDGSPVSFVYWNDGEPNTVEENCAEMVVGEAGFWNDMSCDQMRPAICEKQGLNYVEPTPSPPPRPTCADGWHLEMDRCYYFSEQHNQFAPNWTDAEALCKSLHSGAVLASVRNQEEQDAINAYITDTAFLGATDVDSEGDWKWLDGSPWEFTFWFETEPSGNDTENCLETVPGWNGRWNDVPCDASHAMKGFVCVYDNVVCPEHWRLFDGSCWHASYGETASWQAARDVCTSQSPKADLASIHSDYENEYISSRVGESGWVGLTRSGEEFLWTDKSQIDFTAWDVGEPDQPEGQLCGSVYKTGLWKSDGCDEEKEFACRLKATHYYTCPPGWEKFDGNCYLIQTEMQTWQGARDSCLSRGGDLVSINSQAEADFLKSISHEKQKCPTGWISDDVFELCYFVSSSEEFTWHESVTKCQEMDAQLIEIDNEKKNQRIQSLKLTIFGFWAGASDFEEEGIWKWISNNSQITYSNWNHVTSEPNGEELENCLMIWTDTKDPSRGPMTWNDSPCNASYYNYICERGQQEIESAIPDKWIGLNDLTTPQSFSWSDGSYVSYTNWGSGMPNKHSDDNRQCNFMAGNDDLWYHTDCTKTLNSVCKKPQDISDIPPVVYGCSEGQVEYESSCYELHFEPEEFLSAQATCTKNGGDLVAINSEYEQAKISSLISNTRHVFHIGLKFDENDQVFRWIAGGDVLFTKWGPEQPDTNFDDEGYGKCVEMAVGDYLGYWFVSKCASKNPFICEYPRKGFTTPPPPTTTTPPPEAQCPDQWWTKIDDHCYKVYDEYGSEHKTFENARLVCQSFGGDLVTIQDSKEMEGVASLYNLDFAWIGLKEDPTGEGYYWVDGSPLNYENWDVDYPNSHGGVDVCVLHKKDYGWQNYHCDLPAMFVCEVLAGVEPPTTVPPPTDSPDIPCIEGQDNGWITRKDDNSFCYKIVAEALSWHEAEAYCSAEEGRLASVHSPAENAFISLKLKSLDVIEGWIGLNDLDAEGSFMWTDGSPADYFLWAPNEPSNFQGYESCGAIYTYNGELFAKWNDANCGIDRNGFVCKKPREGGWTTPIPTPVPLGHCPEDHIEHNGHCFLFLGLDDKKSWFDAVEACKNISSGYNLASIHSHYQSALLAAKIFSGYAENFPDFWIGLHGTYFKNTYRWSDETTTDYFLWGPNQPDDMGDTCTQIMGVASGNDLGTWNDMTCYSELPYICHVKASLDIENPPPVEMCSHSSHTDFENYNGECYLMMRDSKTWQAAEEDCKSKDAHLVSINDIGTQLYLLNVINTGDAWIGLSNIKNHQTYHWTDGWPLDYAFWAEGSPVTTDDDVCMSYNTTDGRWYPNTCESEKPFVCKFSEKAPPTPSPFGECPEGFDDLGHERYCYFIGGTDDYNYLDWSSSNTECILSGGQLASVHDEHENSLIHSALVKVGKSGWIGLIRAKDSYTWTDFSPYGDFVHWNENEPSSPETEKCGEIVVDHGKWNDVSCETYYKAYVCKAERVPATTTTTPSSHPTMSGPSSTTSSSPHSTTTTASVPTTSTTTVPTTTTREVITPPDAGLSSGAIAAIVIACLLTVAAGVGLIVLWKTRENQMRKMLGLSRELNESRQRGGNDNSGFVNLAYDPPQAVNA